MTSLNFGTFKITRVTKGALGGKMIIPSDVKKMKYKIPTFIPDKIHENDIPKPKTTFI